VPGFSGLIVCAVTSFQRRRSKSGSVFALCSLSFFNWLLYDKDENVWKNKFKREITKYTRKAIPKTLARADEVRQIEFSFLN
jgi:hypothetical protein